MKDEQKTREQLIEELKSMRLQLVAHEKEAFPDSENREKEMKQQLHKLTRRVKGLDCLYGISKLVATPDSTIEGILRGTVELLPRAWQYPDLACARIVLKDQTYETANFQESAWRLYRSIKVPDGQNGMVGVFYLKEPSPDGHEPFLPEEEKLLDAVAERLGSLIERKRIESSLIFSNTILSTQQEMAPDGILVVDPGGKMISWNQRFVDLWGIPDEVLESQSKELALQSVLGKVVDPEQFLAVARRLYDDSSATYHEDVALADGRVFVRYSAPMIGRDGMYYGRVWYFRDITERKQAENALRVSEERYRSLFISAPSGLFRIDLQGRILEGNPALVQILGYQDFDTLKAMNYFTLFCDPIDAQRLQNLLETRGVIHRMEFCMTHPKKGMIWGRKTIWRAIDSSGNIIGYDGIIDDVSEYKMISQLLKVTNDHFEDLE